MISFEILSVLKSDHRMPTGSDSDGRMDRHICPDNVRGPLMHAGRQLTQPYLTRSTVPLIRGR